jgi:ribosome-associated protein
MTDDDEEVVPSRGALSRRRKADEKQLSDLANTLVGLSPKQLGKLDLDDGMMGAIDEARRISAHAARARQLRVVRRELRESDNEAIAEHVHRLLNPRARQAVAASVAESWASRLVVDGARALEAFVGEHTRANRQHLRVLVRNVLKANEKAVAALAAREASGEGSRKSEAEKAATAKHKKLIAAIAEAMRDA